MFWKDRRNPDEEARKRFDAVVSVVVLSLIAFFSVDLYWDRIIARTDDFSTDFYNELWAPARLLTSGQSPYRTASLDPILPPVWFPMAIGFFFPLGLLNDEAAAKTWFLFNVLELAVIAAWSAHGARKIYTTALAGFFVFFFPPVLNHILLGQFSITAVACLLASAHFAEKRNDWLAAACLALGLSKPQLGILAVFGLSIFYFRAGGFKSLLRFGLQTLLMACLTSLPLFIAYPAWIPDWIASAQSNYTWIQPSLFSTLTRLLGAPGIFLWALAAFGGFFLCFRLWRDKSPRVDMAWTLGLTMIVTPYLWSWDFVLLLPLWAFAFAESSWKRRAFLFVTYLLGWLGFAYVQHLPGSSNDMFWWFPLWFLASVAFISPPFPIGHKENGTRTSAG